MLRLTPTYYALCLVMALSTSACLNEECRDCEGFTFAAAEYNPDFAEQDIVLRNVETEEEITFAFVNRTATPAQEVCQSDADDVAEIPCITAGLVSFRNQDLGVDMLFGFEEQQTFIFDGVDQVLLAYEFKGMDQTQFIRTHALLVEPETIFTDQGVVSLDTLTLGTQFFEDVIDLRRSEEALEAATGVPRAGRFTNIYFQPERGLVGLRNVAGSTFVRLR